MIEFLILLFTTPLIIAILQAVLTRILKGNSTVSNQKIVIYCALLGHLPMGVLVWGVYLGRLSGKELFTASLYAFVLYNLLSYCYFHIFNMSETARRIRILRELYESGGLKDNDLASLYGAGEMLDNRLERLISLGQITKKGEKYARSSAILYYAARILDYWGMILGFPSIKKIYKEKKTA